MEGSWFSYILWVSRVLLFTFTCISFCQVLHKMMKQCLHPCDTTYKAIMDGLAHGNHVDLIPIVSIVV